MKRLFIVCLFSLSMCAMQTGVNWYEPKLQNYAYKSLIVANMCAKEVTISTGLVKIVADLKMKKDWTTDAKEEADRMISQVPDFLNKSRLHMMQQLNEYLVEKGFQSFKDHVDEKLISAGSQSLQNNKELFVLNEAIDSQKLKIHFAAALLLRSYWEVNHK